jgi:hypothetical protein
MNMDGSSDGVDHIDDIGRYGGRERGAHEVTPEVDPKIMGLPRFFWERGSLRSVNEYP